MESPNLPHSLKYSPRHSDDSGLESLQMGKLTTIFRSLMTPSFPQNLPSYPSWLNITSLLFISANKMCLAWRYLRKLSWNGLFRVSSSHNLLMCFPDISLNGNFNKKLLWEHTQKLISKGGIQRWILETTCRTYWRSDGLWVLLKKTQNTKSVLLTWNVKNHMPSRGNNYE